MVNLPNRFIGKFTELQGGKTVNAMKLTDLDRPMGQRKIILPG
jgi:hypothetical protein